MRRAPRAIAALVVTTVSALYIACSSRSKAEVSTIAAATLQPPAQYVTGLTQFLRSENDTSTRFGKGGAGPAPLHGTATWGYYASGIDREPWRSRLLAQQEQLVHHADWPPLPPSGPILQDAEFQDHVLELYVSVDIMPTQVWAAYLLKATQESTASPNDAGSPCAYGRSCLQYAMPAGGAASPAEELHLWRWREGRIVFAVSALGAPGWPTDQMAPLLQYYATTAAGIHGVYQDQAVSPRPLTSLHGRSAAF